MIDGIVSNEFVQFEYEQFPECTVVALDASLDDFKALPVTVDGKECIRFPEKTVKDCSLLDGCVYMHLGRVTDSVMCELIEVFQKLMKGNVNKQGGKFSVKRAEMNPIINVKI